MFREAAWLAGMSSAGAEVKAHSREEHQSLRRENPPKPIGSTSNRPRCWKALVDRACHFPHAWFAEVSLCVGDYR